jgi:hypothetical protein
MVPKEMITDDDSAGNQSPQADIINLQDDDIANDETDDTVLQDQDNKIDIRREESFPLFVYIKNFKNWQNNNSK